MRYTHEWTDEELDYLSAHYCLRGSAFIRAKYPHLTANGCRQQATRLNLSEDMHEYTDLNTVAREAAVAPQSVRDWLAIRPWARRACLTYGRMTLMPLPVIRLYHPAHRRTYRPKGWLTAEQAAQRLRIHPSRVRRLCKAGRLPCALVRGVMYIDPYTLPPPLPSAAPLNYVSLPALAVVTGLHRKTFDRGLPERIKVHGHKTRPACYVHERHVRQFLTAREHRAEQVETIIRRAQAIDASRTKSVGLDTEEK